jgi:hypothetical protein
MRFRPEQLSRQPIPALAFASAILVGLVTLFTVDEPGKESTYVPTVIGLCAGVLFLPIRSTHRPALWWTAGCVCALLLPLILLLIAVRAVGE